MKLASEDFNLLRYSLSERMTQLQSSLVYYRSMEKTHAAAHNSKWQKTAQRALRCAEQEVSALKKIIDLFENCSEVSINMKGQ